MTKGCTDNEANYFQYGWVAAIDFMKNKEKHTSKTHQFEENTPVKLPEVGKKYKHKKTGQEVKCVINQFCSPIQISLEDGNGNNVDYHLTTWDRVFEELPEDNIEEKLKNKADKTEPKSIWKDVSELPKFNKAVGNPEVVIKFKDGNIRFGVLETDRFFDIKNCYQFKSSNIDKYCLLSDWVNKLEGK